MNTRLGGFITALGGGRMRGISEKDMYPRVRRNLRQRYKKCEGWEIIEQPDYGGYKPDFIVERKRRGKIERVVVEVKATDKISKEHIKQLNDYVKKLAGKDVKIVAKKFYVLSGTDASEAKKQEFSVHYLRM